MSGSLTKEEKELIRRILKGAPQDFSLLVTRYQEKIVRLIYRQVGDESTAHELAQSTFIRAFRGLKTFSFQSSFETWLTRIALNTLKTYFTSKQFKNQQRSESFDVEKHEKFVGAASSESEAELLEKVQKQVQILPTKYREVVSLLAIEGKERTEVAAILGVPAGTVASRMHKAIELLRKKLVGVDAV